MPNQQRTPARAGQRVPLSNPVTRARDAGALTQASGDTLRRRMMNRRDRVWIVGDRAADHRALANWLGDSGTEACSVKLDEVFPALQADCPDALILTSHAFGAGHLAIVRRLRDTVPEMPLVVTTEADLESMVAAFEAGAFDCLPRPLRSPDVIEAVSKACAQGWRQGAPGVPRLQDRQGSGTNMIGRSRVMRELFRIVARLANSDVAVVLTGEAGTGKELVARAIHQHSARAIKPFVSVNLASMPQESIDAELFGSRRECEAIHRAGRAPYVEQAAGGTLFLNDVERLPVESQRRLLRFPGTVQDRSAGEADLLAGGIRVLAGTRLPLWKEGGPMVLEQEWLRRLNAMPLVIPPLRERGRKIFPF